MNLKFNSRHLLRWNWSPKLLRSRNRKSLYFCAQVLYASKLSRLQRPRSLIAVSSVGVKIRMYQCVEVCFCLVSTDALTAVVIKQWHPLSSDGKVCGQWCYTYLKYKKRRSNQDVRPEYDSTLTWTQAQLLSSKSKHKKETKDNLSDRLNKQLWPPMALDFPLDNPCLRGAYWVSGSKIVWRSPRSSTWRFCC